MKKLLIITFATFIGLTLGGLNACFAGDCGCACAQKCNCKCEKQCDCHCCKKGDCNCGSDCKCHNVKNCGCGEDCNCSCKGQKATKKVKFFKKFTPCECEKTENK